MMYMYLMLSFVLNPFHNLKRKHQSFLSYFLNMGLGNLLNIVLSVKMFVMDIYEIYHQLSILQLNIYLYQKRERFPNIR